MGFVVVSLNIFQIFQPKKDIVQTSDTSTASSPLMDTQRTLGVLLGLQAAYQARGTHRSPEEEEYHEWLKSEFFAGGLQVLQPKNQFEEEKGESRGSASGGTTPGKYKYEETDSFHMHTCNSIYCVLPV